MAKDLRWHFGNKSTNGKMRHPVDYLAWNIVNDKWPSFAADPHNLRLRLATDGFNPFSILSSKYSCWPVMLVNYNLPPMLCLKKENIMLTLLIPGPKQLGNDIDIYLQPLVDDLQLLWENRVEAYDAFSKSTFNLKTILMWTINDFPAYGNIAGYSTKGRKACPICGKNTHHRWLCFSKKFSYIGHRKFLKPSHPYRRKKSGKGGDKKRKRSNNEMVVMMMRMRMTQVTLIIRMSLLGGRKDQSFFFTVLKELLLHHNLDVMHIEKNICESIISTMLHSGKSKDGINARTDLEDIGIRKDLHPEQRRSRLYMNTLKKCVRNPARPKGCIVESYLAEVCIAFCSEFLKQSIHVKEKEVRNEEFENDVIFEGRSISKTTSITLINKEKDIAHRSYVFGGVESKRQMIPIVSNDHSKTLRWLAYGPKKSALSCKGYIINGLRFHTKDVNGETQNSGVTYDAITMCRESAKDTAQVADLCLSVIEPIKEMVLRKKMDSHLEDDSYNWYVVMKAPPRGYHELETDDENAPRGYHELETDDENADASFLPQEIEMDIDDYETFATGN
ncbi:uncharacterized protein LOC109841838 [Asparagus officinalis]|uniref:uncharacterized protein LOC109841838 n=1 Tax=Asparagus officinalis TaxID=4686 RepID=UPI00098DEB14|nr:uncharacterized protein LOC109841838 [Asparagus officinalis]